jgi:hypothetical protein
MKALKFLLLAACLVLALLAPGCAAPAETVSVEEDVPIWDLSDTELAKLPEDTLVYNYTVEFFQQPRYYTGSGHLTYTSVKLDLGFGMMEEIMAEFDGFTNLFVYDPAFTLAGAQTYDTDGNLIAEIRLTYFPGEANRNPEGKEYHYNRDGDVTFTCTSEFDFGIGEKLSEDDAQGEKETDYYFILPLGIS